MTSVLNVDTIADKAGTGPVALTKQQSRLKAWYVLQPTVMTVQVTPCDHKCWFLIKAALMSSNGCRRFNLLRTTNAALDA